MESGINFTSNLGSNPGIELDTPRFKVYSFGGRVTSGGGKFEADNCMYNTIKNSLFNSASLVITPNSTQEGKLYSVIPSDGSGDLSVTRATTATRVNSAGLVELVPYNLLQYSEDLTNAIWDKSVTITSNNIIAPNGTLTADLVTATSGNHLFQVPILTPSTQYTFSFYVKKGTASDAKYRVYNFDAGINVVAPTSYISQTSTSDWARVSVTFTSSASGTNYGIYLLDSASAGTMYFWGAQLVEGSLAKDYQKTETRLNIPRLDYSNGTCPSILVEPQRTNSCLWSSDINNSTWIKAYMDIVSNAITAPDGTLTADKLIPSATPSVLKYTYNPVSVTSGVQYTYSTYAKADEYDKVRIEQGNNGQGVWFDLTNGTVLSNPSSLPTTIEEANNGWYRISITFTTVSTTLTAVIAYSNTTSLTVGNGVNGGYIWGAQAEAGSYATSYIPTTSASVTRNADVISKTGISSLIGQTEGTIFCELDRIDGAENMGIWMRTGGTPYNEIITILVSQFAVCSVYVRSSSSDQFVASSSALSLGKHKFALAYKANDFAFYIDGVQIATSTSGTPPTCDQVYLGGYPDGGARASKNVATALWKTRLTNTQLAQLTTI